jgi:hypothetical protein
VVKLHGDYATSTMRNTMQKPSEYPTEFAQLLSRMLDEYGLLVVGVGRLRRGVGADHHGLSVSTLSDLLGVIPGLGDRTGASINRRTHGSPD